MILNFEQYDEKNTLLEFFQECDNALAYGDESIIETYGNIMDDLIEEIVDAEDGNEYLLESYLKEDPLNESRSYTPTTDKQFRRFKIEADEKEKKKEKEKKEAQKELWKKLRKKSFLGKKRGKEKTKKQQSKENRLAMSDMFAKAGQKTNKKSGGGRHLGKEGLNFKHGFSDIVNDLKDKSTKSQEKERKRKNKKTENKKLAIAGAVGAAAVGAGALAAIKLVKKRRIKKLAKYKAELRKAKTDNQKQEIKGKISRLEKKIKK